MRLRLLNLGVGTTASLALHAGVAALLFLWAQGKLGLGAKPVLTELDLSAAPPAQHLAYGGPQPEAPWLISKKKVQPKPSKAATPEPAATPLPDNVGNWVPAAQTARKPQWIGNFITPSDYPAAARQEGSDGRVVLRVRIDAQGHVQDVKLLQGRSQSLNEVAVRRLSGALFSPAYTAEGVPVPCEIILPIRFQLR